MAKKIDFDCEKCKRHVSMDLIMFEKRKNGEGKKICKKCLYDLYIKFSPVPKEHYPKEVWGILDKEVWEYNEIKHLINKLNTKKIVRFDCIICGESSLHSIFSMKRRKIAGTKPICKKCALKYVTNTNEWRDNNSKAQFISQNKPEVIEKQRKTQKRLMEEDPLYIEKRRNNSFLSGKVEGIYFDSSWELFYIIYCIENDKIEKVKRFKEKITYYDKNGIKRNYHPDFIVNFKNGESKIIEIKGHLANNTIEKKEAALREYGKKYEILKQKDLYKLGLFVRSEPFLREWYKKIFDNYNVCFNENKCYLNWKERIIKWIE